VNNENHHQQLFILHISLRKPRLPVTYIMQSSTSETCKLQCSLLHLNHYYIKCQQFAESYLQKTSRHNDRSRHHHTTTNYFSHHD